MRERGGGGGGESRSGKHYNSSSNPVDIGEERQQKKN